MYFIKTTNPHVKNQHIVDNCLLLIELSTVCVCLSCMYKPPPHTHTRLHALTFLILFSNSVNGFLAACADDKLEKKGHAYKIPC